MNGESSDYSDWRQSQVPEMGELEAVLRCHICKEFLKAPMMTSCSHTFCSLCIRRQLSQENRCPDCRKEVQSSRLVKNSLAEEMIDHYVKLRPKLLNLAAARSSEAEPAQTQAKAAAPEQPPQPEPGTEQCPICYKWFAKGMIENGHLDACLDPHRNKPRRTNVLSQPAEDMTKKLPLPHFSMMNEVKLRRWLSDRGLPTIGSRKTLENRITEWINLWNANADAKSPVPKSQLIMELNDWERALDQSTAAMSGNIKDIDANAWKRRHAEDFDMLIEQARKSAKRAKVDGDS